MIVSDCHYYLVQAALYMVGRFITGMMGGAFSLTAPVYTSEISEKEIRGSLGSYFQLMVTIGILFVYGVGSATDVFVLSIICGVVPLVFGGIFWLMPETPLYYLQKGQKDRAQTSLQWFRGKYWHISSICHLHVEAVNKQDLQCTYLRHVSVIIVAVKKKYVLDILIVCL
jgi:MFS family permease